MSGICGMKWENIFVPPTHHKKRVYDTVQCPRRNCPIKCGHYEKHEKEIPGCVHDHRDDCPSCRKVESKNEKMSNADHKLFAEISQELL